MFRQNATIVVQILKGAKPTDIPVEQLIKFELAVNARTAQALGLRLPPLVPVRADAVIDEAVVRGDVPASMVVAGREPAKQKCSTGMSPRT